MILLILQVFSLDYVLTSWGENWRWLLLGTTATAANTSPNKAIRAVSNSISCILRKKKLLVLKVCGKKKKENIVVWRFYVLHKKWNLKFHIILVQERQRNTRKGSCLIYFKATASMMYPLLPPFCYALLDCIRVAGISQHHFWDILLEFLLCSDSNFLDFVHFIGVFGYFSICR